MPEEILRVAVVYGVMQGELCRSLLEAHQIPVMLSGEAASSELRTNVGIMGRIEVFVPASRAAEARELLKQADFDETSLTPDPRDDSEGEGQEPPGD